MAELLRDELEKARDKLHEFERTIDKIGGWSPPRGRGGFRGGFRGGRRSFGDGPPMRSLPLSSLSPNKRGLVSLASNMRRQSYGGDDALDPPSKRLLAMSGSVTDIRTRDRSGGRRPDRAGRGVIYTPGSFGGVGRRRRVEDEEDDPPPRDEDMEEDDDRRGLGLTSSVGQKYGKTLGEFQSRQSMIDSQSKDKEVKKRGSRMFASLLGTLQQFQTNMVKEKESDKEQKRKEIDTKIEEEERMQKEREIEQKKKLMRQKRRQAAYVVDLERQIEMQGEHKKWEDEFKKIAGNFIGTKATPKLYWKPKVADEKTNNMMGETAEEVYKIIEEKQTKLNNDCKDLMAQYEGDEVLNDVENEEDGGERKRKRVSDADEATLKKRPVVHRGEPREDEDEEEEAVAENGEVNGEVNGREDEEHFDEEREDKGEEASNGVDEDILKKIEAAKQREKEQEELRKEKEKEQEELRKEREIQDRKREEEEEKKKLEEKQREEEKKRREEKREEERKKREEEEKARVEARKKRREEEEKKEEERKKRREEEKKKDEEKRKARRRSSSRSRRRSSSRSRRRSGSRSRRRSSRGRSRSKDKDAKSSSRRSTSKDRKPASKRSRSRSRGRRRDSESDKKKEVEKKRRDSSSSEDEKDKKVLPAPAKKTEDEGKEGDSDADPAPPGTE